MTNVTDYFSDQNFQTFETRKFNGNCFYTVEPACYNDGDSYSQLFVRGLDPIRYEGVKVTSPLYLVVWNKKNESAVSSLQSIRKEKYRILDLEYFVNFPKPFITYEECNGKWRLWKDGEYCYQKEGENKSEDVQCFLKRGYAPSLVEWYSACRVAKNTNESASYLLIMKYLSADESDLPF